jgi:hypothetical protein
VVEEDSMSESKTNYGATEWMIRQQLNFDREAYKLIYKPSEITDEWLECLRWQNKYERVCSQLPKESTMQPFNFIITKRVGFTEQQVRSCEDAMAPAKDPEVLDDGFVFADNESAAREKVLFEFDNTDDLRIAELNVFVRPF